MARRASLALSAEQNKVQKEPLTNAVPSDPSTVLRLLETVALDSRASVEKLDRMVTLYEHLKAKQAEFAFNAAKGRILKKLSRTKIVKSRPALEHTENGNCAYEIFRYAPLEEIDKHLRPLLMAENMDLSYSDQPHDARGILIRGRLKHLPSGHFEDSFMWAPLDNSAGSQPCRGWVAPIPICAATSRATYSTLSSSVMMTTEPEEQSMRPRPRQSSV